MQSGAFEAYDNRKNRGQFKAACLQFFFMERTQSTRILVESSNAHFIFFKTLVYMRSVTLSPRYYIYKYHLTMSHEKSFNEFIYNSKWQIIIHQRAFIYDRLSFSFPF